ncbi:MAG: DUF3795 domain-containing protein [Anaerolineae bacterium]|nr:DUF3795 domain-containing protein [Anaerolineae bacterium]
MDKMIAYCGLVCTECPAYIATQKDDMEALKRVAEMWGKEYGGSLTAQDCICDGCITEGRKIGHCNECKVRLCAMERGVVNCAHCADYGCKTLTDFLVSAPHIRDNLEAIRKTL